MRRPWFIFICLFAFLFLSAMRLLALEKSHNLQVVKLQLKWKHQFEFAGYYAAIEKGFYEEAGIHVELVLPNGLTNPVDVVNSGQADFGITGPGILLARAQNKKMVVLASIFQHSPFILIVPQNSGITSMKELRGKTIAMESDSTEIIAALAKSMVFPKPHHIVPLKYNAEQLLSGEADAISSYITDEPFLLDSIGFKYTILTPNQSGVDFYGDVLFTTENLIETDPDLVERFRQASIQGWNYAMDHPQEIIFLIFNKYSEDQSVKYLNYEMEKMKELIRQDFVEIGYSNPVRWSDILADYQRFGLINPDFTIQGLMYEKPASNHFSWKLFGLLLLIFASISLLAYIFYRNARNLKNEIENSKKLQAELAASEALYRSVINASPDTITITDLEGNIEYSSPQTMKMFGYYEMEYLNQSIFNYIHPDDYEKASKNIHSMFGGVFNGVAVYRGIKADGKVFYLEINGDFICDAGGLPKKMIFVSRDITERKAAEEKFLQSETRFRQIVEQSQTVIWEVDANGLYTYVSPIVESVWGYSPNDLIGKLHFYDIHPEKGREEFKNAALQVFEKKLSFTKLENQIQSRSGELLWVETNGVPILDNDNVLLGYRGSDNDITARKKSEAEIKELNAGLEAKIQERTSLVIFANKKLRQEIDERKVIEAQLTQAKYDAEQANHAKSEFLSRMSHELRTPMNSILGFGQLLEMGELTKSQKKGVQHILKSGKHLLSLINEVLDITRIEAGRLSISLDPVQLAPTISEIIEIIRPQTVVKQLSLQLKPSATNRLFVVADKQRFHQILINLLGNAIKYNKPGGSITIQTEVVAEESDILSKVRISITDTGIGIHPESTSKLFKPFERIGAEQTTEEGSGLGLTVVKKLIEAMSGSIGFESVPEEGSTFWIELPLAESQLKNIDQQLSPENIQLEGKTGTVLYIEDNQPNIDLVEQILTYQRSDIKLFTNMFGKGTVDLANELKPDLIILDLNLPDTHGSEVIKELKADAAARLIPVVVVSADAMPGQMENLKWLGAVDYLTKPIDVPAFLNILEQFIPG